MTYTKNTGRGYTQNVVNENNHTERVLAYSCSIDGKGPLNKNVFRASLRSGFTLIELLVVVLIIGILTAIAMPQYNKVKYKTDFSALLVFMSKYESAQEQYFLANGKHATTLDQLDIDLSTNPRISCNCSACEKDNITMTCEMSNHGRWMQLDYHPKLKRYRCNTLTGHPGQSIADEICSQWAGTTDYFDSGAWHYFTKK